MISKRNKTRITGIGGKTRTEGTIDITLELGAQSWVQTFHVLPHGSGAPDTPIIGLSFLEPLGAIVNLTKGTLSLTVNGQDVHIPFEKDSRGVTLRVPRRCQYKCEVPTSELTERVVLPTMLAPQVLLARSVVTPKNGMVTVLIANATDQDVEINDFVLDTEPLSDYEIVTKRGSVRWKTLQKRLKLSHLTPTEKALIEPLCKKYRDIFFMEGDRLTTTPIAKQHIRVKPGTEPVYKKPFRNPVHQKCLIQEHIAKLRQQRVVEPCISPWNSPLVLVPKKNPGPDGKRQYRVCIDYRGLNAVIEQDRFPLPNIQDLLDQLSQARYFTCMDLSQGYFQVELDAKSRPLTAFIGPDGEHLQMTRMPMGLSTSPAAFSRIMCMALTGLRGVACLVYLDDLIVYSQSFSEHLRNLADVFQRLREANLKIHPDKTHFLQKSVVFLGYKVSEKGIQVDPTKFEAIRTYPPPTTKKEVQRFYGFANFYRQFIKNFAALAMPLSNLTKKNVPFVWTEECETAFQTLKTELCSKRVLAFPDFTKEFIVYTDASKEAIGAILTNHNERPVHYASRALKDAETRYAVVEQELLAIVFATRIFRPYLLGRHFLVRTDHRALQWLHNMSLTASRLTKWRILLDEFDFTVEHLPGTHNAAADALSRKPLSFHLAEKDREVINALCEILEEADERVLAITRARAKQLQAPAVVGSTKPTAQDWKLRIEPTAKKIRYDPHRQEVYVAPAATTKAIKDMVQQLTTVYKTEALAMTKGDYSNCTEIIKACRSANLTILVLPNILELDNDSDRKLALDEAHILPTAGHAGVTRMYRTLRQRFYWPGMFRAVEKYVSKCEACKMLKKQRPTKVSQILTDTPGEPFERVFMDLVGSIDPSSARQHSYVLTIKDDFSKYVVMVPIKRKTAAIVAETFVKHWVMLFGMPSTIVTDQGSEFAGVMAQILKNLGIEHRKSTAYHHQTVGSLEQTHGGMGAYLRTYAKEKVDWDIWLPHFSFAYNTTVNSATGYTPFELLFGRLCRRPSSLISGEAPTPPADYDEYLVKLKYALHKSYEDVRKRTTRVKENRLKARNVGAKDELALGDRVFLEKGNRKKMDPVRTGPYIITDISAYPNVSITRDGRTKVVHADRLLK